MEQVVVSELFDAHKKAWIPFSSCNTDAFKLTCSIPMAASSRFTRTHFKFYSPDMCHKVKGFPTFSIELKIQ